MYQFLISHIVLHTPLYSDPLEIALIADTLFLFPRIFSPQLHLSPHLHSTNRFFSANSKQIVTVSSFHNIDISHIPPLNYSSLLIENRV
jgi:hypothetical protein